MVHRGVLTRSKDFCIADLDVILGNRADGVASHRIGVKGDLVGVEVAIGAQDFDVAGENGDAIFLEPFQVVCTAVNLFASLCVFLFAFLCVIRCCLGFLARFEFRPSALHSCFWRCFWLSFWRCFWCSFSLSNSTACEDTRDEHRDETQPECFMVNVGAFHGFFRPSDKAEIDCLPF